MRTCEQQRGLGTSAALEGKCGKSAAELDGAGQDGRAGGLDGELDRDRLSRVEQPVRDPQRVVARAVGASLEELGQAKAYLVRSRDGHRLAHDLGVERVRDAHRVVDGGAVEPDEASLFHCREHIGADQLHHLGETQRLAEREQLQRRALVRVEPGHAHLDELGQGSARRRPACQLPEPPGLPQGAACERAEEQLPHVEHVALAALEEPESRALLDGGSPAPFRPASRVLLAQCLQVEPYRARVLPERLHGVRAGLARAQGRRP